MKKEFYIFRFMLFKIKVTLKVGSLHGNWIDDRSGNVYLLSYIGDGYYEAYNKDYELYNDRVPYSELMEGINKKDDPYLVLNKPPDDPW
jgi:hypothetical protein